MKADAYVEKTSTSQEMPALSHQEWKNTKKRLGVLKKTGLRNSYARLEEVCNALRDENNSLHRRMEELELAHQHDLTQMQSKFETSKADTEGQIAALTNAVQSFSTHRRTD
jgi:predicted nuclease with TOPRIM domain